jgi:hypothetical protein
MAVGVANANTAGDARSCHCLNVRLHQRPASGEKASHCQALDDSHYHAFFVADDGVAVVSLYNKLFLPF